jgi:hypothetical protein
MTTYRERRLARADRLEGWAEKREAKADAEHRTAAQKADAIPIGQPLLVDHYSYGRDRRYRDSITRGFERSHEHATKAADMARRANGIRAAAEKAIYSDDEDAIERLQEKIVELEAERKRITDYNKTARKAAKEGRDLGDTSLLSEKQKRDLLSIAKHSPYQLRAGGAFPSYATSNLSGQISKARQRLEALQAQAAR